MTSLTMRGAVAALSSQHTQPGATTAHSTSLPLSRPFSLSLSSLSHSGSASSTRPLVPVASRRPLLAAALAEGGAAATEEGAAGFEEEVEYVGNDELLLYFKVPQGPAQGHGERGVYSDTDGVPVTVSNSTVLSMPCLLGSTEHVCLYNCAPTSSQRTVLE